VRGGTARDAFRGVGGECASPGAQLDSRRTLGWTSALSREPALESCQGENAEKEQPVNSLSLFGGLACLADEARPNDDPFDALICAAARTLELPLLTRDRAIQEWGKVRTLW